MAAIEKYVGRGSATKPPTGLLLSIGSEKPQRGPGRPIDHFRPKAGELEQFAAAATTFHEVYGDEPKVLDDVYFLSNNIGDLLNIRVMAWGAGYPKIVGDTNYATLPPDEWEERAFAFDDDITYYPSSPEDVKSTIRDSWNGEPIRGTLTGPGDARIEKLKANVECTLTFCLPKVMGFGTVAQITTKSRKSMRNLVSSLNDQASFFQGQLVGIPFRLTLRPRKGRHFTDERRYVMGTYYELVLDTPFTVQEAIDAIRTRREALGGGQPQLGSPEADAFTRALALPVASEQAQTRDEPGADTDRPDDATLNRVARLEEQIGPGYETTLKGVFGVDSALELDQAAAEQYERILERALPLVEDGGEVEVVDMNGDAIPFGDEA